MPSSSAGDAPPWSGGTPGWARNVIRPWRRRSSRLATLTQRAVAAVAVHEHEPAGRRHRHAAPDVVEHGEHRRRRQPDRARRPGVLVRLRVGERRQQPHVELVADTLDGGRAPRARRSAGRCERQVRTVLLDRPERLDEDAARVEAACDVGRPQVGERRSVSHARHATRRRPMMARRRRRRRSTGTDFDAIVIGAGHNGLVTAAYLARAGMRTLLLEARADGRWDGGQRAVRRRHRQHLQLRPHHVPHDAGDGRARPRRPFGLRYLDVEPAQVQHGVDGRAAVAAVPRRRADRSTRSPRPIPARSTATAATSRAARAGGRADPRRGHRAADRRGARPASPCAAGWPGRPTVLRWSRRSAADVHALVLRPRRPARHRPGRRPDGVGRQPRAAGHRARRADATRCATSAASAARSAAAAR